MAFGLVVDVGLAGPVAALAAERAGRRPRIVSLPVRGSPDVRRTVVMAERVEVTAINPLTAVYFVALPPFAWAAKRAERREPPGWRPIARDGDSPTSQY